ncbi:MAG: outer membrane protein transport protein [bacterium]
MSDSKISKMWVGIALLAGSLVTVPSGWANGFRNPPEGSWALGRVGGKIAQVDDASAISHNPANLTSLDKGQAQVSMTVLNTGADYSSPMGSASTEDPWKFLPNLFVATPLDHGNYAAGIGVTTPFGQSTVWDKDSLFRYSAPYFAEMKVININPTVAAKLNDQLSVGVGLDVFWSSLDLKQRIPWSMLTGVAMPDGQVHLSGTGQGVGGNAAVTYRPAKGHAIALTYRSPVKVDYSGDCDLEGFPMGAQALGLSPSSDFDTTIEFPSIVGLGYGIQLTDTVRVEADVEWIQFSSYDTLSLNAANNNLLLNANGPPSANPMAPASVRQNWKDTWTFGMGADWKVAEAMTLRAGYIYLQSPVPEETLAPTLPDASRHVFSLGAGYRHQQHSLDLAYAYSMIGDRNVASDQNPAFNGTYELTSHLMSLSYGYSF